MKFYHILPFILLISLADGYAQKKERFFKNDTLNAMQVLGVDYFDLRFPSDKYITSSKGYEFMGSVAMMYAGRRAEQKMYVYSKNRDKDRRAMLRACQDADKDSNFVITPEEAIRLYVDIVTGIKKPRIDTTKTKK